jgi:hypothetical protein
MSEIDTTSTTLRAKPAINDPPAGQTRNHPGPAAAPATAASAAAGPTDPVEISAAAQTVAGPGRGTVLTDEEAQSASVNLRQQIGLLGLSASAKQNAAVLSLVRPNG